MMENEGPEKILDRIIIGEGTLTDAFITAQEQVKDEKEEQFYVQEGVELHNLGEADKAEKMTVAEKKKMWGEDPFKLEEEKQQEEQNLIQT